MIIVSFIMAAKVVDGAYNVSEQVRNPMTSIMSMSRRGAATFVRNDILYTVGGERQGYSSFGGEAWAFSINEGNGTVNANTAISYSAYTTHPVMYAQAVLLPDNDRVLLFGGSNSTILPEGQNGTLFFREYRFSTDKWVSLNVTSSTLNGPLPTNRYKFTATLASNGRIYIFGGRVPLTAREIRDLWEYDPTNGHFTEIPLNDTRTPYLISSISAIALPDGKIVYPGVDISQPNRNDLNTAFVFDTNTRTGSLQPLYNQTTYPPAKYSGNAILAGDNKTIYYFGGTTHGLGGPDNAQNNLAYNNLDILDTETWTWTSPNSIRGEPPRPRYDAASGVLLGKYWVIIGGLSEYYWTNDFNILALPDIDSASSDFTWLYNITDPSLSTNEQSHSGGLAPSAIVGIVLGSVAFIVLVVATIWMARKKKLSSIAAKATRLVNFCDMCFLQRVGEPRWIRRIHLLVRAFLMFLFTAYLVYTVNQVVNSPTTRITLSTPANQVQVPDIRFCFDGWNNEDLVEFSTDTVSRAETRKWNFTNRLDMSNLRPYYSASRRGDVQCWLFTPSPDFKLSYQADLQNNGTRLKFLFAGVYEGRMNNSRVHISIYPPNRDPNKVVYQFEEQPLLSNDEIQRWTKLELDDQQPENIYTAEVNTYSSITYQFKNHRYLADNGWNTMGFASIYNNTPEVDTDFRTSIQDEEMMVRNTVDVYPINFMDVTEEEQRIYTIVMAVGSVGGLLSLFMSLDSFLFGSRPSDVIGIVQKIPIGRMKRSIRTSQLNAFGFLGRPVPFVHPVDSKNHLLNTHQRQQHNLTTFGPNGATAHNDLDTKREEHVKTEENTLQQRVAELTRRLQLMELVFKNYYIDDKIFENLEDAHHCVTDAIMQEEVTSRVKPGNTHGDSAIARFFRRRQYARQETFEDEEQLHKEPS
ncbi:galactose oxidase [Lichtheimia hyalospora FSU 10163]|nr:galactose oxidase [Lichtheimia hyalospora FSU 10163]